MTELRAILLASLWATPAVGQTALPPAAPGTLDQAPETAPSAQDTEPRHDGLYLRASVGPGYFYAANRSLNAEGDRRVISAGTASLRVALGGTLRGGFITLGGGYFRDALFALRSKDSIVDGDEPDLEGYDMTLQGVGFHVDAYLGRTSGTHVQALLGRAWLSVDSPTSSNVDSPNGTLFQLGGGHEFWLDQEILVGAMLQLSYARLDVTETSQSTTLTAIVPTLLLTATVN